MSQQTFEAVELIVVDNFSEDGSERISREFTDKYVQAGPERSAQRNLGAQQSSSKFLLFVDADMELTDRVVEDCMNRIPNFDALIIPEISTGTSWVARARQNERACYSGTYVFEAARFLRREVFESLRGYDIRLSGLEDYDLQARLEESGYRIGHATAPILHHEESLALGSHLRKKAYYARGLKDYTKWHSGRATKQFGKDRLLLYFRKLRSSPKDLAGVFLLKFLEYFAIRLSSVSYRFTIC